MDYKKISNLHNSRVKSYHDILSDVDDEVWLIKDEKSSNAIAKLPENPDNFTQFINIQSEILISQQTNDNQKIESIINLYNNLTQYPDFTKFICFNNDTLCSIQYLMSNIDLNRLPCAVSLLRFLIMNLPIAQNCVEVNLVESINEYIREKIYFEIAAELIDILAILASKNKETSRKNELFHQMLRGGIVTAICDILSYINPQKAPSRDKDPLSELPYVTKSINLETSLIIFPILVFSFHFLNWKDSLNYNVTEELIQHLIGLLSIQLSNDQLHCLMNTLMDVSKIHDDTSFSFKFIDSIQKMGLQNINIIANIAKMATNEIQIFAIQILLNLSFNDNQNILLNKNFIDFIFEMLKKNINDSLNQKLLIILENLSFNACNYINKHQKSINVMKLFHLDSLKFYFEQGSFSVRKHIGEIFVFLLERNTYRDQIIYNINILDIFLPLLQSGNENAIIRICNVLESLIENFNNNDFKIRFCSFIKEDGIFNAFDESGSCSINVFEEIKTLEKVVNEALNNDDEEYDI